ncbi:MAG: hypothetical protein LJE62_06490 [Silicimonas sp.]|nr:hypothetical protein [Silicimonas sp.]
MSRPLQNRVLATGEIVAHPARGRFMGNRGILHDERRQIGAALWRHRAWIICVLQWKDWHRDVMTPGAYTELFFLDEAVALAAGHRPCALCRRERYNAYREAARITGAAAEMDAVLHDERAVPRRFFQRRDRAEAGDLPDGTIVFDGVPWLIWGDTMREVRPEGYGPSLPRVAGEVTVLTPPTTRRALSGGYVPEVGV